MDPEKVFGLISALQREEGFVSVLPVSTCNRTEIYLETTAECRPAEMLERALTTVGVDAELFFGCHAQYRIGLDSVDHLYRVASGLESMMLGEPQISSQLKDSYRQAREHHELGAGLLRAFQGAFRAGKRVRTETRIGAGAVSMAFAAVELSRKFFASLEEHTALLVGAGETGALAARHFLQQGIGRLTVVNRSYEKAAELTESLNAEQERRLKQEGNEPEVSGVRQRVQARAWDELAECLGEVDVVLSTTGALEPVITADMVATAVSSRRGMPLFLLDIAVPRDIAAEVGELTGAFVFGLDDLDEIVQGNLAARRSQLPHADRIIAEELKDLQGWLEDVDLRPTVAEFRAYLEDLKDKQVGFVRKNRSDEMAAEVERSLQQFIKKVLGRSVSTLKQAESPEDRQRDLDTLRRLFSQQSRDES